MPPDPDGGEVSDVGGDELDNPATPVGVLDPEFVALDAFPSIKYTVRRVPAVPRFRVSVLVSNLKVYNILGINLDGILYSSLVLSMNLEKQTKETISIVKYYL